MPAPAPTVTEPSISPEARAATGTGTVALAVPGFKGDQVPIVAIAFGPPQSPNGQPRASVVAPPARSYKMSDDQSPRPQDRAFLDFNYYDNVGAAISRRLGIPLHDVAVYRETFGFEKTFLDNNASLGLRLPLNTLSASSDSPGQGGTDTDVGDLTAILKYAFWRDPDSGSLISAGLAVTADWLGSNTLWFRYREPVYSLAEYLHNIALPKARIAVEVSGLVPATASFAGYIWMADHWFVHGFTAVAVPTGIKDVTSLYNSIGVGYIFSRACPQDRLLTSIAPTFEVHVSDPLNHRGAFKVLDPLGTPDVVDLTMATTFGLGQRSSLSVGIVTPVTGPKPFDVEALVQFNWYFGARRSGGWASTPNVIGQ